MEEIKKDVFYVGVDDKEIDLFEGILPVRHGMAYNSYVIKDEKCAVIDSVDSHFKDEWLKNVEEALGGASPDYIVVLHMEPDHSANVYAFTQKYPRAKVVGNAKTFVMLQEFFGTDYDGRRVVVKEGDKLSLGKRELTFVFAPMVHWPEVMTAYESSDKILFSADAFGKFGARSYEEEWESEARRYYFAIVGKYGAQVQALLKKLSAYDIATICSLHGPILSENLGYYIDLYSKWSSYAPETDGVLIAYSSVYGHTKAAAELLENLLKNSGVKVECFDIVRTERTFLIAKAFEYSKAVFATTTYNADIFPAMREFLDCIAERNYGKRTVAFIENGSWAPVATRAMQAKLEKCKDLVYAENAVKIRSALNDESKAQIEALARELSQK